MKNTPNAYVPFFETSEWESLKILTLLNVEYSGYKNINVVLEFAI